MFSRNAASSRAVPIQKMLEAVENNPFIPVSFVKNQKGMQSHTPILSQDAARNAWLEARDHAVKQVKQLDSLGVHKQLANRLLEPFSYITVVVTGAHHAYNNFFKLRCHPDAEQHINMVATMLRNLYTASAPTKLEEDGWHCPFHDDKIRSVAACARVSYLRQFEGTYDDDVILHGKLAAAGHWSPFEHVAQAVAGTVKLSNFGTVWLQYRKTFDGEY